MTLDELIDRLQQIRKFTIGSIPVLTPDELDVFVEFDTDTNNEYPRVFITDVDPNAQEEAPREYRIERDEYLRVITTTPEKAIRFAQELGWTDDVEVVVLEETGHGVGFKLFGVRRK
jgi:hypothetical protein